MSPVAGTKFFSSAEYTPPGWTGFHQGLGETFGNTPARAQYTAKWPDAGDFLYARQLPAAVETKRLAAEHDNKASANLWPLLQSIGQQDSFRPLNSKIELGDARIKPYVTSYAQSYAAPFPGAEVIRSPLKNGSLTQSRNLIEEYRFALQRVGEKRLGDIMTHMRERFQARISNRGDNAFKLRKFAKMYDKTHSGYIGLEDFRVMTETSGMQLDDDSLLALFSKYDTHAEGRLRYVDLMRDLLDDDALALFTGARCELIAL